MAVGFGRQVPQGLAGGKTVVEARENLTIKHETRSSLSLHQTRSPGRPHPGSRGGAVSNSPGKSRALWAMESTVLMVLRLSRE